MKKIASLLGSCLFFTQLFACSSNHPSEATHGGDSRTDQAPGGSAFTPTGPTHYSPEQFYGIQPDPGMSVKNKDFILQKLKEFHSLPFTTDDANFHAIFGGNDNLSVINYISDRVQFLASGPNQLIDEDISYSSIEGNMRPTSPQSGVVIAYNIGRDVWLNTFLNSASGGTATVRGIPFPVHSTRLGIIYLGNVFFDSEAFMQVSTLAHEGRHSDCTGGMSALEYKSIRDAKSPDVARDNLNSARPECGHIHSACPKGHDLEGLLACDNHPWGAYAVDAVFFAAMEKYCEKTGCDETIRQQVSLRQKDSSSRLEDLAGFQSGKWGIPDMGVGPISTL